MLSDMTAILFARHDSIYKQLPGCDVYDAERNALTFPGGMPVVAHPPCRAWGRLRGLSKPADGEQSLAWFALDQVRRWGGVLEHPETSLLWRLAGLPLGVERDYWGGFTLSVDQSWWGHRARKRTWLYIVGVAPSEIPAYPISLDTIQGSIGALARQKTKRKKEVTMAEREHTPQLLAEWLVELTRKIKQA
jgi:hypothetical protein